MNRYTNLISTKYIKMRPACSMMILQMKLPDASIEEIFRLYQPILMAPQNREANICFDIISDKLNSQSLELSIKVLNFSGK